MNPSELLTEFEREIQRRSHAEDALRQSSSGPDPQESQLRATVSGLLQSRDAQIEAATLDFESVFQSTTADFDQRLAIAEQEHRETLRSIESNAFKSRSNIEKQRNDSTWVVTSVMDDSAEDSPARVFDRFKSLLQKSKEDQTSEWEQLEAAVATEAAERDVLLDAPVEQTSPPPDREAAAAQFTKSIGEARSQIQKLRSLILPQLVRGFRSVLLFLILAAALAAPIYFNVSPQTFGIPQDGSQKTWLFVSAGAGAVLSLLLTLVLYTLAAMRQSEILRQLIESRGAAYWAHQHWLRFAKEQLQQQQREFEIQQKKIERDRKVSLSRFEQAHEQKLAEIDAEQAELTRVELRRYAEEHASLSAGKRQTLEELQNAHQENLERLSKNWTSRIEEAQSQLEATVSRRRREQQEQWGQLKSNWERGWQNFESGLRGAVRDDEDRYRSWSKLAQGDWQPPERIPQGVRVGRYFLDLNEWPGAVSKDPRLAPRVTQHQLPFALPFPEATSVLFKSTNAQARTQAIGGLQCLMLRLLTLLPPGKLRFTIIDPVGLGESFGGFMHLADFDELLVTSRIWTEANQIEARLADLTEHMENVLQKYLRNEFQTIEEYNESAGEVAEPYHVLVISDFPAKFSEIAARRLISIVNSGPRCGVYTLMNCDPGKQMPNNFSLADIQSKMFRFEWKEDAFRAPDSPLPEWPITIDTPPPPEEFTSIVKMVGDASKDARRVEVSFTRITPPAEQVWKGDSRSELVIPLGRAGATKLQQLRLGKGTSQHMLVAGKTGSGKSTFLHILITNLALHYSPDEVNFFLIDFKKGVEFKDYATHRMPHARIIAVESDREFGVSALVRLGDVLQERGELFRRQGVQDIAGFRNATGKPLPRILLVVDEFQEFFVEDDKISQNAALLLDRLVRQGRAFGIHVILGSQTLGGAYSLARSTLGQVAVRVALQCSEADAHLILSEDNTAARLLTRPGEAIYNDANGMLEGNHPFQIAWITDAERETALDAMQQRLRQTPMQLEPTIVFEGNIPSDLTRNAEVDERVREYPTRSKPILTPTIWLGDAVEIAPATAITLHRQSGSNVLLVGQDADAALGVMAAAMTTLAASLSPEQDMNSLFVLDGSHAGTVESDAWKMLVETLPVDARLISPGETGPFLQAMSAELKRRETENDTQAPPIVLLVFNIARFRDLRKVDDDFGMGSFGGGTEKPAEPGKLFSDLLSRGPSYGIHAIIWCDSFNNVDRWFSRQTMRELELRIAFQVNAADSSNLIDSPAASRLGTHRALIYREETGTIEKFRPYGLPPTGWLNSIRSRLLGEEGDSQTGADSQAPADEEPELPDLEQFSIQ
ncbi:FtsK/SpoIIIE domain-containing protein [Planctomicrobium sp. SH661]|uniref:FtsK/SpoIIIE domain-containing protein n=1 Tax=Planctomicrobium sp. SH661 TaxID=3448124 RepID=UPI003F5C4009